MAERASTPHSEPEHTTHFHDAAARARELLDFEGEPKVIGQWFAEARYMARAYLGLVEQLETFLDAAWKFENEMSSGEFVHFGEFRRALVAASGEDRASNPATVQVAPEPRHPVEHYCIGPDCPDCVPAKVPCHVCGPGICPKCGGTDPASEPETDAERWERYALDTPSRSADEVFLSTPLNRAEDGGGGNRTRVQSPQIPLETTESDADRRNAALRLANAIRLGQIRTLTWEHALLLSGELLAACEELARADTDAPREDWPGYEC